MHNITTVFFDLDHTLWDFERNSKLTYQKVFDLYNVPVAIEDFLAVYIPLNHSYWKLFRENKISKEKLRFDRLHHTFLEVGLRFDANTIHMLADAYIKYLATFNYLIEGAEALLRYLSPKYKMHIITNGFHEVQHRKIEASGIAPFFDKIITSEMVGVKKPDPKIFEYALELAGVTALEAVMIGDNLEADIRGAQQIGMQAIFFSNTIKDAVCRYNYVDNLFQIQKIL